MSSRAAASSYVAVALLGLGLAAFACDRSAATADPDARTGGSDSLVGATGVSPLSTVELDELADTAVGLRFLYKLGGQIPQRADINNRPIHMWFLRGTDSKFDGLMVVGHAEHECCAKVSAALQDVRANNPGLEDWTSYGVGSMDSGGDGSKRSALDALSAKVDGFMANANCSGQIAKHELELADVQAFEAEIAHKAKRTCEIAEELDRALAVHVSVGSIPAFVPLYRSADGVPVGFELRDADLNLSQKLRGNLTVDQVARERRELRWAIAEIDKVLRLIPKIGPSPDRAAQALKTAKVATTGDVGSIKAAIEISNLEIERTITWCRNAEIVASLLLGPDAALGVTCQHAEDKVAENEDVLASLPRLGVTTAEYWEYESTLTIENPFQTEVPALKEVRTELRKMLKTLERYQLASVSDAVPVLIDAVLRGWPATFAKDSLEAEYDRWAKDHQANVWAAALASLRQRHGFADAPEALLASNVYFEVIRIPGDRFEVIPHYVHDTDFYIVCEPGDPFARYESVTTDQNLLDVQP